MGVFAALATVVWPQGIQGGPQVRASQGERVRLAGSVLLDDGMPPASPIAVELICEGLTKVRTETDQAGRFGLEFDSPVAVQPDCSLRASLTGYRSGSVPVAEVTAASGRATIALHRDGQVPGRGESA